MAICRGCSGKLGPSTGWKEMTRAAVGDVQGRVRRHGRRPEVAFLHFAPRSASSGGRRGKGRRGAEAEVEMGQSGGEKTAGGVRPEQRRKREFRESCKILGYDVPKGTTVLVNIWAISRDPRYTGKMRRSQAGAVGVWHAVDFKGTIDFERLSFGVWRMCPGMMLVVFNMELVLAAMLYRFDWKLQDGLKPSELDMTEEMVGAIRKKKDLHLHPIIRVSPQSV
ncbi:hypothetical protein PR202_ga06697 [Eleusine coracana subsp. coracana]|uniref:Uncharacterized protein n=1 Tax=Eleusine coracana subsp. coracana TaxID=191504 RepID=A0AAV5BVI9_ELECO|nr:hypothetical protein PR202_ga06697 [Eleusine coracana subsp. coracana]